MGTFPMFLKFMRMKLKVKFERENMWQEDESEFEIQNERFGETWEGLENFCELKLLLEAKEYKA